MNNSKTIHVQTPMHSHGADMNRRRFIALSSLAALGTISQARATGPFIQPQHKMTKQQDPSTIGYADGKYVLPPLPYAYDALEPMLDEKTVRIHHDKHHAAYVAGANAAAEKLREIADGKLDASATTNWVRNLSFNASGHVLHTIYWTNMTPDPKKEPQGPLVDAIKEKFGSLEAMMKEFKAASQGVEGSGWGILGVDPISKTLVICGAEKHQNLEIPGLVPILVCDVWEHAYYLDYQNRRPDYVQAVRKLCDEKDLVLIVDEVQTGVGRTGTFLCCEHYNLQPDVVTLAKGLGGGLPIGAVLMNEKVAAGMGPSSHGSTFGGNPVVCAGANVVVDRMDASFLANVNERAVQLRTGLEKLPRVRSLSGIGLMVGIEFLEGIKAADVLAACREKGLLVLTAKTRLRLLPPLTLTAHDVEMALDILGSVLAEMDPSKTEEQA